MANFLKQLIIRLISGCTRYWQTMWSRAWTICAPCYKAVKSQKANSNWLRWAFLLRTICPSRRMPPLSTPKRWIGRCSTISVFPVSDWSRMENWKRCSIGRRAISSQLLFLSVAPPSTLKHALRSVRTITAISVWQFIP